MPRALLVLLASLLLVDTVKVRPREASSYPARETHEGVTIAAEAYATPDAIKLAFEKNDEKHDPRHFEILPVYVVIFNPTKDAVRLDHATIELTGANRQKYPQIAADDVSRRILGFRAPQGIKPA